MQQAVEQGYVIANEVDVLKSYIGDSTKADELYAELQNLAKETDYLYKKIEKICAFKPMNVTHDQLVNLERSLSELIIEERQLQSFYATDLIKNLIQNVSDKLSILKGKTGQLNGLFFRHEKKLNALIEQRQTMILISFLRLQVFRIVFAYKMIVISMLKHIWFQLSFKKKSSKNLKID